MPRGPPNLGENSKKKKEKTTISKVFRGIPRTPRNCAKDPKFIIITAKNSTKTISEFSCFAVHRALNIISKEIISISTLRDGNSG